MAIASDGAVAANVPVVPLDDIEAVADILVAKGGAARYRHGAGAERLMAQLTDDCFAFGGPLLSIDACRAADRRTRHAGHRDETVAALKDARGRVLAADVIAPIDLPPFDNSAVDGYAVRHADVGERMKRQLAVVDRLTAGRAAARDIAAGEAIRIFTGAPMPRAPTRCSCRRTCASRAAP